jgi:methyltransferase
MSLPGATAISLLIFVPMLLEAILASRNERRQRHRGGVEPAGDVYSSMRVVYPASFLAMLAEGLAGGWPSSRAWVAAGLTIFAAAKAIKWSAILSLGPRWTFRVIVVPGEPLVTTGPYRYMRHPNYVGVVGELIAAALMTRAAITGPLAVVVFGRLLQRRIAVEEGALKPVV